MGQPVDDRLGASQRRRISNALQVVGPLDLSESYVFAGGEIEAHEVLKDDSHLSAQAVRVVLAEVFAVEQDTAFCGVVEAHHEFDQGRLAGPIFSDQGNGFSGTQVAGEILEDIAVRAGIAEGDVAEFDSLLNGLSDGD